MFDRFVVVDWSASSTPKSGRDSIWIGVHDAAGAVTVTNLATRAAAEAAVVELFEGDSTSSTLIGVDFSLGYPQGTAAALGLTGIPWAAMWRLLGESIVDDDRNANNRFAVAAALNRAITGGPAPFWGCPPAHVNCTLGSTKSEPVAVGEWRIVEALLRAQGRRPFSSWQLLGAGAVGSQSLLGIPMLVRLRERLGERVHVWPFTTGFATPALDDGSIVVAEVWPSMLTIDTDGTVRDAAQVAAMASWLAETDRGGGLDVLMAPELASEVAGAAIAEEGWVLGVVP